MSVFFKAGDRKEFIEVEDSYNDTTFFNSLIEYASTACKQGYELKKENQNEILVLLDKKFMYTIKLENEVLMLKGNCIAEKNEKGELTNLTMTGSVAINYIQEHFLVKPPSAEQKKSCCCVM